MLSYVIITPARNEAKYITLTIESMIHQTHRPLRWVVVSDGSTDETDEIVRKYTVHHAWIELLQNARALGKAFRREGLRLQCRLSAS